MDEGLTLDEICKMLGEKDLLIYRLQRELAKLQEIISGKKDMPVGEE